MAKTQTSWLVKFVLPASAAITTAYTVGFTSTLMREQHDESVRDPADLVLAGDVKPGWEYRIYERSWPQKSYNLDVKGVRPGAGAICAVEVKGWPRPVMAAEGPGATLRVVFDRPLEGMATSAIEVDLIEGTRMRCAVNVTNGVVMDPPAMPGPDRRAPVIAHAGDRGV